MVKVADMARTLLDMARQGGGTLDLSTGVAATHESGYYVGGAEGWKPFILSVHAEDYIGRSVEDAVFGAVVAMRGRLGGRGYVGVWEHNGVLYIDATDWHAEEWDALEAGRARGELCVWDIAKGVELTC